MKRLTKEQKEALINKVIDLIKEDINSGDLTALDELLRFVPTKNLIGYLPEELWGSFENDDRRFICNNCGGGFKEGEMCFGSDDGEDVCNGCNAREEHSSFMNGGK